MRRYLAVTFVVLLAACGAAEGTVRTADGPADPPVEPTVDRGVLIRTVDGVVNAATGSTGIRWSIPGAIAAVDGSAVYAQDADRALLRIDPESGETVDTWSVDPTLTPVLVEPGGGRVVMSDRPTTTDSWTTTRASTHIEVVDTESDTVGPVRDVAGDFEPEAFGSDPPTIFGLDHRGDHYRVQWLNLVSGERGDVSDREKNPGEDMRGRPIHGVLSSDGATLSTLYVNSLGHHVPAFVHVLDLGGSTYCVDLAADFATGPPRSQSIEITDDDVLVIRAPAADQLAEFDLGWLQREAGPEPARIRTGAGTAADAPYREIPGFLNLLGPA